MLNVMLAPLTDNSFYYFCSTSCWIGNGEGRTGIISPGHSVKLDCMDNDLQVTLSEMP